MGIRAQPGEQRRQARLVTGDPQAVLDRPGGDIQMRLGDIDPDPATPIGRDRRENRRAGVLALDRGDRHPDRGFTVEDGLDRFSHNGFLHGVFLIPTLRDAGSSPGNCSGFGVHGKNNVARQAP